MMHSESGARPVTFIPEIPVKNSDLRKLAKQYFIPDDALGTTQLIRRIQLAEGHFDCFATVRVWTCNQFECRWRKECLLESTEFAPADS